MKKVKLLIFVLLCTCSLSFSQQWAPMGTGVENTSGDYVAVYSMLEFNNELYVAGCFTSINGVAANYIAKYNGTTWSPVGEGLWHTGNTSIMYSGVRCMAVYNGELYVGGIFNRSGNTTLANVAKWNGTAWVNVGSGFNAPADGVISLCVFNNELYAGGNLMGIYNAIAKWNGSAWSALGTGIHQANGNPGLVRDMKVYNNKLYIGGQFSSANNVASTNLITWNGTSFASIGTGVTGDYGISTIASFNNELVVAGGITHVNGVAYKNIARFNGTIWSGLGAGLGTPTGNSFEVEEVLQFHNKLVAIGFFTTAGTLAVNGVAAWNGSAWETMGQGFEGIAITLGQYHDSLFTGGVFSAADGAPAKHIARWTEPTLSIGKALNNGYVKLFPNPSTGIVNIEGEDIHDKQISIFDASGREIFPEKNKERNILRLDISGYPSGLYLINITANHKTITCRLIKS